MCSGPSRPPRLRPQGFSPSRRFPRMPGLRGLRHLVSEASYAALGRHLRASLERLMPLPFRTSPIGAPSRFHPQESRVPSGTAGSLVVRGGVAFRCGLSRPCGRSRALISLASSRRPLPSGPPSPRRRDCSRASSCAADLGAVAGRGPGLERRFTSVETPVSSSPAGTANRAHPRDAPSTSERSSSRVPDALPQDFRRSRSAQAPPSTERPDSWVVTFVGFFPSRASFRLQASGPD